MKQILLFIISLYQYFISPYMGSNCRFHPTCSSYAKENITLYGAIKGGWLAVKRLAKCHPFYQESED